jgi:hypothetical protein
MCSADFVISTNYRRKTMEPHETEPTPEQLDRLAGHILLDSDFRAAFAADPKREAEKLGIYLTPAQVEHLSGLNWQTLEGLAEDVGEVAGFAVVNGWSG